MFSLLIVVSLLLSVMGQCNSRSCNACLKERGCVWGADSCNQDCPYGFTCLGLSPQDRCPNPCSPDPCNGRGRCQEDGSCVCERGWSGWDCSVDITQCNLDSFCSPGYCDNGTCKPRAQVGSRCNSQSDKSCADGMRCMMQNTRVGVCIRIVNAGEQCYRNEHCLPYYQRCVNQRCLDTTQKLPVCYRSRDCPNTSSRNVMTCQNGTCVYAPSASGVCRVDTDCTDEETCSAGRCWTGLPSCRWDGDCDITEQCKSATCVDPRGLSCRSWTDCVPASCIQGVCQSPQCDADWQCPVGSSCIASRCLVARVCRTSNDCLPGEDCQLNSNRPQPFDSNQQVITFRRLLQNEALPETTVNRQLLQSFDEASFNSLSARMRGSTVRTCRCSSLDCRAHGIPCASDNDCDENFNCRAGVCLYQGFGTMWPTPFPTPLPPSPNPKLPAGKRSGKRHNQNRPTRRN